MQGIFFLTICFQYDIIKAAASCCLYCLSSKWSKDLERIFCSGKAECNTDSLLMNVYMSDGFGVRSRKAPESVPVGTVRVTDTELAPKTPTDVHELDENQYKEA